mgnify:CR=1 FL=1
MILNCLKVSMLYRTVWLSSSKNLIFIQEEVHVKSAIDEQSRAQLEALAKALVVD